MSNVVVDAPLPHSVLGGIYARSGAFVDVFSPSPDMMLIEDIAYALSNVCRFNGHTSRFYSVAEHSVRVSSLLEEKGESPSVQMTGLLHDASEAYMGDIARPLKLSGKMAEYLDAEDRLSGVIAAKFGTVHPMPPIVEWADNVLLATEARDLLRHNANRWAKGMEVIPGVNLAEPSWNPGEARFEFMERYRQLSRACVQAN